MTSGQDINIRPIQKSDILLVKKMMDELHLFHGKMIKTSTKRIIDGCFESKLTQGFVVEHKSKCIGFSFGYDVMNYIQSERCHFIDYFFIKEKYRSIGYGQALLNYVITSAQKRDCGLIYVTASKHNQDANSFYKKCGFKRHISKLNKYVLEIPRN
jgi:GNAT superfamily N-acetyltransferase